VLPAGPFAVTRKVYAVAGSRFWKVQVVANLGVRTQSLEELGGS